MAKKPETLEELLLDEEQHPNRGKINGEYVANISTSELIIFLDGALYNALIRTRTALGFSKSQLAQEALVVLLRYFTTNETVTPVEIPDNCKSEFRGSVSNALFKRVLELGASKNLDRRQTIYLALHLLVNDPVITGELDNFISTRSEELGCTPEEVIEAMYGLSKALSRKERIKLLKAKDPKGKNLKMDV